MNPKSISINDYTYNLPDEKIAEQPLIERDQSKLLVYKNGKISQDIYKNIADHLPENSLMIFNNTKVIQARILFKKETGGIIEIFCLEPFGENNDYAVVMNKKEKVQWKCMIGGASKWKEGSLSKKFFIEEKEVTFKAALLQKIPDAYVAEFNWEPGYFSFAEVIEKAGDIPLPPYIKRKTSDDDKERYQTIYAMRNGSVATPTAGLHFTEEIFCSLKNKNIDTDFVTLHVGAGTFKPVKSDTLEQHKMHSEWIDVSTPLMKNILKYLDNIVAVGTTSLRTIESLYWMGVKTILNENIKTEALEIKQWDVYEDLSKNNFSKEEAILSLIKWMKKNTLDRLFIQTQILIAPGYQFKIAKALITNFHQPKSTLILLVAAAVGNEWKKVYEYALQNDFRFLSYGDGSLIFI